MITDAVKMDETGLHAEDCECVRCSIGFRPTELERATARRSLALQRAIAAKLALPPPAAPLPRRHICIEHVTPATPAELDELKRLHAEGKL